MLLFEVERVPLDPRQNTLGRIERGMLAQENLPVEVSMEFRILQLSGSEDLPARTARDRDTE
jgi:hypothetical protein